MGLKEAYQEKIEAQLKEWSAKITELKAKADKTSADAKIKLYQELDDLKARKEAAQQKLNEIKAASAEKWESLKTASDKAVEDLKHKWESIKAKFH
jgi:predicted nuclease with TOPRIM domain